MFTPRIPGEVFHANPFPGVGSSLGKCDNTHTRMPGSCHATAKALQPAEAHTHLARWDDSEEMASNSWRDEGWGGWVGPLAPLQHPGGVALLSTLLAHVLAVQV